jgi:PAS domain S-box-containing protein
MNDNWTGIRSSFRDYTQQSRAIYSMMDRQGCCFYVNPAWTEFTGQPHEQAISSGWHNVVHPKDVQHTARVLRHGVENGVAAQVEFRFLDKDSGFRWISATGRPLLDRDGTYDCYIGRMEVIEAPERRNLNGSVFHLTEREREVLTLIAMGKTSDEVGTILELSRRTVDSHVAAAIEKTSSSNRIQAVVEGLKRGEIILS